MILDDFLNGFQDSLDHPEFYFRSFSFVLNQKKEVFKNLFLEEEDISRQMDETFIQESTAFRNVLRARKLAQCLISPKSELKLDFLKEVYLFLKSNRYSLGPGRKEEAARQDQLIAVLELLEKDPSFFKILKSIRKPEKNKGAEILIRETLHLPLQIAIDDVHAKQAALAAWFCYLRQSVGSCFATAPAILIHQELPLQFLKDIKELFEKGVLSRSFGGMHFLAPLSESWGSGDFKKPFSLQLLPLLAKAPGMIFAFEAFSFFDEAKEKEEKKCQLQARFEKLSFSLSWSTPEEVVKKILMEDLGLTKKDLEDFENRSRGMLYTQVVLQSSKNSVGGKSGACLQFFASLEKASLAFRRLTANPLLKAWEFTLASFSETKAQFTRWNLYSSLGMEKEEAGGIGECVYHIVEQKLAWMNQRMGELQTEYEHIYNHVKLLEGRLKRATSEQDFRWSKAEYESRIQEFYTFEEMRNTVHEKARRIAELFKDLMEAYDSLFQLYFQEVYDPDIQEMSLNFYDDAPAGFRLYFKYGRSLAAQWTPIKSLEDWVQALATFFITTENELLQQEGFQGLEKEITEIVTEIVRHVRTKEFAETAFYRMAKSHRVSLVKDPLNHLDQIEKKPWVYSSGGVMQTFVSSYFCLTEPPKQKSRWVESPTELALFLVDSVKQMPEKVTDLFKKDPNLSLLMNSPTHAFLFKPGLKKFSEAWQSSEFTYTWLRDRVIEPMKEFWKQSVLDELAILHLMTSLAKWVPKKFQRAFLGIFSNVKGNLHPSDFRQFLQFSMEKDQNLQERGVPLLSKEFIDSHLYQSLPLFPKEQLSLKLKELFNQLSFLENSKKEALNQKVEGLAWKISAPVLSALDLQNIAKGLLCLATEKTSLAVDIHQEVAIGAKELGFSSPFPFLFADTNWSKDWFGFVVNPGSETFELWRLDITGCVGFPMSDWEKWLNGSLKTPPWCLYTDFFEYHR